MSEYAISDELRKTTPGTVDIPRTVPDLGQWMKQCLHRYERFREESDRDPGLSDDWSPFPEVKSFLYVATSIDYRTDKRSFIQRSTGPNYKGGIWSLGCCRPKKRNSDWFTGPFQRNNGDRFSYPTSPMFVITSASASKQKRQPKNPNPPRNWIASIAFVTHGFKTPEELRRFVRERDIDGAEKHIEGIGYKQKEYEHLMPLSLPGYWTTWEVPSLSTVKPKLNRPPKTEETIRGILDRLMEVETELAHDSCSD